MHTHLSAIADPEFKGSPLQGMSEQTAMLLVAVCIRCAQIHAHALKVCWLRPRPIASEACTSLECLLEEMETFLVQQYLSPHCAF